MDVLDGVAVTVGVNVSVGVDVGVRVGVDVFVGVGVRVEVDVGVALGAHVAMDEVAYAARVGVNFGATVGVLPGQGVCAGGHKLTVSLVAAQKFCRPLLSLGSIIAVAKGTSVGHQGGSEGVGVKHGP